MSVNATQKAGNQSQTQIQEAGNESMTDLLANMKKSSLDQMKLQNEITALKGAKENNEAVNNFVADLSKTAKNKSSSNA